MSLLEQMGDMVGREGVLEQMEEVLGAGAASAEVKGGWKSLSVCSWLFRRNAKGKRERGASSASAHLCLRNRS